MKCGPLDIVNNALLKQALTYIITVPTLQTNFTGSGTSHAVLKSAIWKYFFPFPQKEERMLLQNGSNQPSSSPFRRTRVKTAGRDHLLISLLLGSEQKREKLKGKEIMNLLLQCAFYNLSGPENTSQQME